MQGRYNVLFLRTGNSTRSIMAEAIMNHNGRPKFTAHSAGSYPAGRVRPAALRQLETARLPTSGLSRWRPTGNYPFESKHALRRNFWFGIARSPRSALHTFPGCSPKTGNCARSAASNKRLSSDAQWRNSHPIIYCPQTPLSEDRQGVGGQYSASSLSSDSCTKRRSGRN
jgi:Low molecular weight phosphotyrosine protein phosphatase